MVGRELTTTEGGRRPSKLCASCGRNTASAYDWGLEQTSVRFLCRECRDGRAAGARATPVQIPIEPLLPLDDEDF